MKDMKTHVARLADEFDRREQVEQEQGLRIAARYATYESQQPGVEEMKARIIRLSPELERFARVSQDLDARRIARCGAFESEQNKVVNEDERSLRLFRPISSVLRSPRRRRRRGT